MSDAFLTIATIAEDRDILARVAACVATQDRPDLDERQWANAHALRIAASPGFAAAWDSAVAGRVPNPGADPAVISDGQLLATVQHLLAQDAA